MDTNGSTHPQIDIPYTLRCGRSMRSRPGEAREHYAVKFAHIPERTDLAQPGVIRREGEKLSLYLKQDDGANVRFAGLRGEQKHASALSDYLLVFCDGQVWLERVADTFYNLKPDTSKNGVPVPSVPPSPASEYSAHRDPDSWMMPEDASSSPITPEGDLPEDHSASNGQGGANGVNGTAGKSTVNRISGGGKMVSAGRRRYDSSNSPPLRGAVTKCTKRQQQQSVARKTVANKGPSPQTVSSSPKNRTKDDDDDDDDSSGSSEDSSSDDSDSESGESESDDQDSDDQDSDAYTEKSTDED